MNNKKTKPNAKAVDHRASTNDRPSARSAGGTGASEGDETFVTVSGPRKVSAFGISLDSIGYSFPTHHTPSTIWEQLLLFSVGLLSWDDWTMKHQTSYKEARAVLSASTPRERFNTTQGWLAGTDIVNADGNVVGRESWIDRYGCAPMNAQIMDRLSYFAYDPSASEWDPTQNIEPQAFVLSMLSSLYVESCNMHFAYLLEVDRLYHQHIDAGRQGTFNEASRDTPYANLYFHFLRVLEGEYLDTGKITLPSRRRQGHFTIKDIVAELLRYITTDGRMLHSDIILTQDGVRHAMTGASLGTIDLPSHKDEVGTLRFYNPQWFCDSDHSDSVEAKIPASVVSVSTGIPGYEAGNDGEKTPVHISDMSSQTNNVKEVKLGDWWGQFAGFNPSIANPSLSPNRAHLMNMEMPSGLTPHFVSLPTLEGADGSERSEAVMKQIIKDLFTAQQGRGYMLNLVDLTDLYRRIGRQVEPYVLDLVSAKGTVVEAQMLLNNPVGLNIDNYVQLYNGLKSRFMFNENPNRHYSAAHMGPRDEKVDGHFIGEREIDLRGQTVAERYWTPPLLSNTDVSKILGHFAPGVGLDATTGGKITLRDLADADLLPRDALARAFGNNDSMITKAEKPVVVPAGMTGEDGTLLGGSIAASTRNLIFTLVNGSIGGLPHFGTGYIPWTDVQYDTASERMLSDVDSSGASAISGRKTFLVTKGSTTGYQGTEWLANQIAAFDEDAPDFNLQDFVGDGIVIPGLLASSPATLPGYSAYRDSYAMSAYVEGATVDCQSNYAVITAQGDDSYQLIPEVASTAWGTGHGSPFTLRGNSALNANDVTLLNAIPQEYTLELESALVGSGEDAVLVSLNDQADFEPYLSNYTTSESRMWGRWGGSLDLRTGYGGVELDHVSYDASAYGQIDNYVSDGTRTRAPSHSVHETVIGAVNAALAAGSSVRVTNDFDYQGEVYQAIKVFITAKFGRKVFDNSNGDDFDGSYTEYTTQQTTMPYYLLFKRNMAGDGDPLFTDAAGRGLSTSLSGTWRRVGYAEGQGTDFQYDPATAHYDWAVIAGLTDDEGIVVDSGRINASEHKHTLDFGGEGIVAAYQAECVKNGNKAFSPYAQQWVWPGDDRLVGINGLNPLAIAGSAVPMDSPNRIVAAGRTSKYDDSEDMQALGGAGTYSNLTVNVAVSGSPLGLTRFVGAGSTFDTGRNVLVVHTMASGAASSYAQAAALYGAGRDTVAVIVPDRPENRAAFRPYRNIVDCAIEHERRRSLVPIKEEYSPEAGALGISYIGQPRPFEMYRLIVEAGLSKQYLLEPVRFHTRMVDMTNRRLLTFGRVAMIEEDNTLRMVAVAEELNSQFPSRAQRYATDASGSKIVYDTPTIRAIQLGQQRQNWS